MSPAIFEAFENRGILARRYLAGAQIETSAPSHSVHEQEQQIRSPHQPQQMMNDHFQPQPIMQNNGVGLGMNGPMGQNPGMDLFGAPAAIFGNMNMQQQQQQIPNGLNDGDFPSQRAQRNPSFISFGGGRAMSFGEASYGRAMSGLSALSIDWENMDDFDINVDHSAHINNGMNPGAPLGGIDDIDPLMDPKPLSNGDNGRRSSIRQFMVGGGGSDDAHVSFKV